MDLEKKITKVLLVEESPDFLDQALNLVASQEIFYEDVQREITTGIKSAQKEMTKSYTELKKEGIDLDETLFEPISQKMFEDIEPEIKKFYKSEKTIKILEQYAEKIKPTIEIDFSTNAESAISSINEQKYDAVITSDILDKKATIEHGIKGRTYSSSEKGIEVVRHALKKKAEVYLVSAPIGSMTQPNGYTIGGGAKTNLDYDQEAVRFAKENKIPFIKANVSEASRIATKNFETAFRDYVKGNEEHTVFLDKKPGEYLNSLLEEQTQKITNYVNKKTKQKKKELTTNYIKNK